MASASRFTAPTKRLNDGHDIPILAFGTGQVLHDNKNYAGQDCRASVTAALAAGIRHIDTAERFENETGVGEAVRAAQPGLARDNVFVSSKLGRSGEPVTGINESLQKLGFEHLDLYLVHSSKTFSDKHGIKQGWRDLEVVRRRGAAKSIGVASFSLADLDVLLVQEPRPTITPAVLQTEFHPLLLTANEPLMALCAAHAIVISCFGTLVPLKLRTQLQQKRNAGDVLTPDEARLGSALEALDAAVRDVRAQTGLSEAQVLWKWAAQVSGGVVVVRSDRRERIAEAASAFGLRAGGLSAQAEPLSGEQLEVITEAGRGCKHREYQRHLDRKPGVPPKKH